MRSSPLLAPSSPLGSVKLVAPNSGVRSRGRLAPNPSLRPKTLVAPRPVLGSKPGVAPSRALRSRVWVAPRHPVRPRPGLAPNPCVRAEKGMAPNPRVRPDAFLAPKKLLSSRPLVAPSSLVIATDGLAPPPQTRMPSSGLRSNRALAPGVPQPENLMGYEIPYADPITAEIDLYRRSWEDLMRMRIRLENRGIDHDTGAVRSQFLLDMAEITRASEDKVGRRLEKLIRDHPMADWLADAKTQGKRVATILTTIRHPHRFPSQMCSEGCHLLPTFDAGEPCPCETTPEKDGDPEPCAGVVQEKRRGTGCRALWKMLGLYPVTTKKGKTRLATYMKGVQGSHSSAAKTAILMPQGIAQQFYMQGSPYEDVYRQEKERLAAKNPDWPLMKVEMTARVIAAKAWSGDLLVEWKQRVSLEGGSDGGAETDRNPGPDSFDVAAD